MDELFDSARERRDFARFSIDLRVQFLDTINNKKVEAQARDISAKGIGIYTNEALPLKTEIELWVEIPNKEEPLYIKGKVVWSKEVEDNKYRVGICLDRTDLIGVSHILRSIYGKDWL